jgi:tetratricopeptide (TPR) repeat protein
MSKPILVPLPFLLIVLDYWPLNRLADQTARSRFVALMREKWPLFALSILSCSLTLLSQEQALNPQGQAPLMVKAGNALIATTIYLGKTVWPVGLAAYYPFPSHGWLCWQVIPCLILLVAVTVAVMILRRSRPYLAVGWFWYLVMLAPASGIIQAGAQAYADRFTYLPQIGLWIALVWLLADLTCSHRGRIVLGLVFLLVMTVLVYASYRQAMYWHDNNTLMIRTLQNTTENRFAHLSLADSLLKNGQLDEALNEYLRSTNGHPGDSETDAEKIRRILLSQPNDPLVSYKLGEWLDKKGDRATAIQLLDYSLNLDKANPATMNDLSWILSTAPEPGLRNGLRALKLAQEAVLMLGSNNPAPLDTLAAAYAETGDFVKALEIEKRALKLAEIAGNNNLSLFLAKRISLYQRGKPCRDPE